jgi:hypothetical protein
MKKKKYDTSVVMLYLLGQEKLLPKEFRKEIPYSTVSSWRKVNYEVGESSPGHRSCQNGHQATNWPLHCLTKYR